MTINFSKESYMKYSKDNPFGSQAKLLLHFEKVAQFLKTGDTNGPIFMEINLTNNCNLACYWCISENFRGDESLKIRPLERFFKDFKEMGGKALTFSGGGEPTLYKHFVRATESAKENDLELGLMTNGVYTNKYNSSIGNNFEWVRFSLDTINEKNYKRCKNHNAVQKVLKNINTLKEYPVNVGVNCNIGDNLNVKEVKDLVKWFIKKKPADYLQFRPILHRYFKKENSLINEKAWDYLDTIRGTPLINFSDDKFKDIKENNKFPFRNCIGHFFEPILNATGEVQVCMYHPKDDNFTFGNIYDQSFKEIWKSDKRKKAIKYTKNFDYVKGCQFCCKLTEPNKLLDFLSHPKEVSDANFL
ncbi:radical SAM protein [Candidatus Pacearchaeota archaeon]|nr:radical SAM protein [Candidatus Pacearchaeota archaeon]